MQPLAPSDDEAIAAILGWVERAVIGLDLCPFAKPVVRAGGLRVVVSAARDAETLLADFEAALVALAGADPREHETTLLVHPHVLGDFLDYNDFLDEAEGAIAALGLEGEIQVASFHPGYRFAGSAPDDVANNTNRSPYPCLHLLREASIERALRRVPGTDAIFERNIATLRRLGADGWARLMRGGRDADD